MSAPVGDPVTTTGERAYRLLLRAYPAAFRAEYGREMSLVFRDQCRAGEPGTVSFWIAVLRDVARSAPALRVDAWRVRARSITRTLEEVMKITAMLTMLVGAFGGVGAVSEGMRAGAQGSLGTSYLLACVLAALAGALLLATGVVLMRGTPSSRHTAMLAAGASLALMVIARFTFGWMSIFYQLIGIGLPVVLLAVLYASRSRSTTGMA